MNLVLVGVNYHVCQILLRLDYASFSHSVPASCFLCEGAQICFPYLLSPSIQLRFCTSLVSSNNAALFQGIFSLLCASWACEGGSGKLAIQFRRQLIAMSSLSVIIASEMFGKDAQTSAPSLSSWLLDSGFVGRVWRVILGAFPLDTEGPRLNRQSTMSSISDKIGSNSSLGGVSVVVFGSSEPK